jgi:hypothetical protein
MDPRARLNTEQQPDMTSAMTQVLYRAGYGARVLDEQHARSSDAVGDRIVAAAQKLAGGDLWGTDPESWDPDDGLRL